MTFEQLILKVMAAQQEAAKLGLWRTYHALNNVTFVAGYERAAQVDPKGRRVYGVELIKRARTLLRKGR